MGRLLNEDDVIKAIERNACNTQRIMDAIEALPSAQPELGENTMPEQPKMDKFGVKTGETCADTISRQAAIDGVKTLHDVAWKNWHEPTLSANAVLDMIRELPSAQPERDIPVKPIETTDQAWGIPHRQAVCPKCDYYLGHVAFLSDYKGKRITYCETCGQAIDWEGWDFDE